ncbi:MAG: hypothetical protein IKT61_04405 [Clostridia bacterium]|nr:hypothetical protein [Clostridia bacterium]
MKRFFALIVSAVIVILSCVTASAAGLAKFNITLVSETDKQAVVTIDFNGGTGFSGFDFDVITDEKRVEVVSAENGKGFSAFQKQANAAFALINPDSVPVKGTMVVMPAYRNIGENKDLYVITLKKLTKEPLSYKDFSIEITNCIDSNYNIIETSLTTDLQGTVQDEPSSSSVNSTEAPENSTDASTDTQNPEFTNSVEGTSGEVIDIEPNAPDAEEIPEDTLDDDSDNKKDGTKGIIIAVAAVVLVAAAGGITAVVMKKKKSPENGNEE